MRSFFPGQHPPEREAVLDALRDALHGIVNARLRIHKAEFLDFRLADFFASDGDGRVFAVRWMPAADFPRSMFELLGTYARLHAAGRDRFAGAMGVAADFPPVTLILVSNEAGGGWGDVVSTLDLPIIGLRVHSLQNEAGEPAGCFFERCFSTADLDLTGESPTNGVEPVAVSSTRPQSASPAELPEVPEERLRRAETRPVEAPPVADLAKREANQKGRRNSLSGDSGAPVPAVAGFASLTDEEAVSFRMLENVLAAR